MLLVVHVGLLAWGAVVHSPTIDESEWLPVGLAHWHTGRIDIMVKHPPHVGLVAAIPLLFADPDVTAFEPTRGGRAIGHEFIQRNGYRSFWLFTLGRWACIPFSILGGLACFLWARGLYGANPGVLAAALWRFCPNIIANGQLVSHDVPASALGLVAGYTFWRWLRQATWAKAAAAGLVLGLALLTKMTLFILLPLWPAIWAGWRIAGWATKRPYSSSLIREGAMLGAILLLALDVLNAGYGFQGSFNRLDSFSFRSHALAGEANAGGNRFQDSLLGSLRIPLPRPYVEGLDFQRFALEGGLPFQVSYLRGQWSTRGWPYYYLYALAIKVPIGTWFLALLSLAFRLRRLDSKRLAFDEMVLLAPAATIMLVASMSLAWTDHLRHILPCFPFAFVWISRVAGVSWAHNRVMASMTGLGATASVLSSLLAYPHSLSYFNELVGGPRFGHYYLLSSNIDFGQDLLKLKHWYDRHPRARPFGLAYWDMESVDPRTAGIEYFVPPSGPRPGTLVDASIAAELGPKPGWYAVTVNLLHGDEWPGRCVYPELGYYGYFLEFTPVAHAGYSIYIYHLTADEVNRVRVKLGLPIFSPQERH
jgi:4-amino-4-deoxy-L-arabinose transferase-like glycosyltransferase